MKQNQNEVISNLNGMSEKELEGVHALGSSTRYPTEYDPTVLEKFKNPNPENDYVVSLDCFEVGSLCPRTHQPDLATIYISYVPDEYMVESKSLKLYLFSYRNHGAFHERCVNMIVNDLVELLHPKYLEVYGDFNSRGGIHILPFVSYATESYKEFEIQRKLDVMQGTLSHHRGR